MERQIEEKQGQTVMTMPRGGAVANRYYSEPVIKKEPFDIESSSQILNLTSIFSPQSYNFEIKEEPTCQWYVAQSQGLTPNGPTSSPIVEKSPSSRPQVSLAYVCNWFYSLFIDMFAARNFLHGSLIFSDICDPPPLPLFS